jgi:hypothetical protein
VQRHAVERALQEEEAAAAQVAAAQAAAAAAAGAALLAPVAAAAAADGGAAAAAGPVMRSSRVKQVFREARPCRPLAASPPLPLLSGTCTGRRRGSGRAAAEAAKVCAA